NLLSDNELPPWTSIDIVHVKEELGHRLPGQCPGGQDGMSLATGYMKLVPFLSFNLSKTGHTETVRVVYEPENISFEKLLKVFWENHDPTQGMRQGNDFGTQYRSAIYTFSQEQMEAALRSKEEYQK
ncbi:PREDICTED: mitochondrial peptide methionine sulfoxide reductase, partial [Tauraco erythrolophus]|uniref:mitochondrial peptide methionine sulfoxide reductase n=1 Tax=Tauraco erythrolophus TaxID=121530 RepID=UPI000523C792